MTNNAQQWPTMTAHHTTTPPHHHTTTPPNNNTAISIWLRGATVECKTATGSIFGMQNWYKNLTLQLERKAHLEAKRPKNSTKQIVWLLQQVSHQVLSVPFLFFMWCFWNSVHRKFLNETSFDCGAPWSLFQPVPAKVHLSRGSSCAAARAGVAEWVRSTESSAYL